MSARGVWWALRGAGPCGLALLAACATPSAAAPEAVYRALLSPERSNHQDVLGAQEWTRDTMTVVRSAFHLHAIGETQRASALLEAEAVGEDPLARALSACFTEAPR